MDTAAWLCIRPRLVRISELRPCQDGITWQGLFATKPFSGDRFPFVVRFDGGLFIEDGHHRVARAALRGHRWILARVKDLDNRTPGTG